MISAGLTHVSDLPTNQLELTPFSPHISHIPPTASLVMLVAWQRYKSQQAQLCKEAIEIHTFQTYDSSTFANIIWAKENDMTKASIRLRRDYKVAGYRKAISWGH